MKTIRLRFVREPGLLSWLIDRCTGGFIKRGPRWSHVGALVYDKEIAEFQPLRHHMLYEFGARDAADKAITGKPGVQFRSAFYATFAAQEIIEIPVADSEWRTFWSLALRINGCRYSSRTIAGFVEGENIAEKPHELAFDCSTAMAWLLLHSSRHIIDPRYREMLRQISPNALYFVARDAAFYRQGMELFRRKTEDIA